MSASDDTLRAAEKRGYGKGYAAGLRRKQRNIDEEKRSRARAEFFNRALLAALPACIAAQGWKRGTEPINNIPQRVSLAVDFADEALKRRRE